MCITERGAGTAAFPALGQAAEQKDVERAVETLSEGIKSAAGEDHHRVCPQGCVCWKPPPPRSGAIAYTRRARHAAVRGWVAHRP